MRTSLRIAAQLAQYPRALEILITLFAGSQFLTEILLRYPNILSNSKITNVWPNPSAPGNCWKKSKLRWMRR